MTKAVSNENFTFFHANVCIKDRFINNANEFEKITNYRFFNKNKIKKKIKQSSSFFFKIEKNI